MLGCKDMLASICPGVSFQAHNEEADSDEAMERWMEGWNIP
jgi:hypothetical protein